jgi:DNA-binding CsgD family transcriptional regulator
VNFINDLVFQHDLYADNGRSIELRSNKDSFVNFQEKQNNTSKAGFFLFILAFIIICCFYYCNKFYKLYIIKVEKEKEMKFRLEDLENKLGCKNKQISSYFFNFQQKNSCINQLLTLLKDIEKALPSEKKDIVKELKMSAKKSIAVEKRWEEFHSYFEEAQFGIHSELMSRHPNLRSNDLKICSLLRLNLTIKESADILGISTGSLKTARYRLRKKLGFVDKENLINYLISLEKKESA